MIFFKKIELFSKAKFINYTFISFALGLFFFLFFGYIKSDALYYKSFLKENSLIYPKEIFQFISKNYKHDSCKIVHPNATPRHLISNHKRLFCDEGATVIATLCYYAGYETRLVRMISIANVDNHTFLQVKENSVWKNYDFTFQTFDAPIDSVTKIAQIKLRDLNHYEYPRIYNKVINANYFLKQAALFVRGIKEHDFVK